MKQYKKIVPYVGFAVLTVFFCWLFVGRYGCFGADVDWISQHSVIPDYFRKQFYETGELFPEFALNLGGGQNIYNFAYYGLYSPVILISYLLPGVEMGDYLMAASVICLAASVLLFYYWIGKKGFDQRHCFWVTLMFLLASPMIYQSYVQVMFVNYMPFLLLALIGTDSYFEEKSGWKTFSLYIISVFLMILTSFYFSVGGILALMLYGLYCYAGMKIRTIRRGVGFILSTLLSVMMSGFLLIPTAFSLFGRGGESVGEAEFAKLLIPEFIPLRFLYNAYGLGLTTLVITVLITGLFYRKWQERFLAYGCVVILTVPVFAWILNGGLYIRDKVMIPFLPLVCYLILLYLEKLKRRELSFLAAGGAYLLTMGLLFFERKQVNDEKLFWAIFAEALLMFLVFLVCVWFGVCRTGDGRNYKMFRFSWALVVPPVVFLFLFQSQYHRIDGKILDSKFYEQVTDSSVGQTISELLQKDNGFYRLEQAGNEAEKAANLNRIWDMDQYISSVYSSAYNQEYDEFRRKTFGTEEIYRNALMQGSSDNPLFRKVMGVKYRVRDGEITEMKSAAPIIYATDQVISKEEYAKLLFPYSQMVLADYAVTESDSGENNEFMEALWEKAVPVELKLPEEAEKFVCQKRRGEREEIVWEIDTAKTVTEKLKIPQSDQNRLLYLQFRVENLCPEKDVAIWCEGIRNKLTCENHYYYNGNTVFTYVMEIAPGETELEMKFGKGNYEITDIQCYQGDSDILDGESLYQSEIQIDEVNTMGNRIAGTMDVEKTGYLVTSIPYDPNFEIMIDGEKAALQKVNTAFLGCTIKKGKHEIEILYHAPGAELGKLVSELGFLVLVLVNLFLLFYNRQSYKIGLECERD